MRAELVAIPQTGIFALGTGAHAYLEFDLAASAHALLLVSAAGRISEPRTTMGGVNVVTGFRPEIWRTAVPNAAPDNLAGFTAPVVGRDGYTMPATQHDLMLWISGSSYDVVFDTSILVAAALRDVAVIADEIVGWTYHRDLDLTGFIDGTKNPSLSVAPAEVLVPDGLPGAGGSVLLLQKWQHDSPAWTQLPVGEQEKVIGRTKPDSVELDPRPETSHVARTDQDEFGKIFRRNTPYGSMLEHGTTFVGFSARQRHLATMLDSMAGVDGERDVLTRFSRPLSGSYYFVPSLDDLAPFAPPEEDD
jgi:putative iron-dependent peroxidase